MKTPRIALAGCFKLPEPDPDAAPLRRAIQEAAGSAEWIGWDDPAADLTGFDLCVIRSTWNYIHDLPGFLRWIQRAAKKTRVLNPRRLVRWNADKLYLRDLAGRGIPTVPTLYIEQGRVASLPELLAPTSWTDVVIKPRVGAASFATRRFGPREHREGSRFLAEHAVRLPMLIQPYVKSVEDYGERALIWIGGSLTHAIRKNPRLHGQAEGVSGAVPIASDEAELAARTLEPYAKDLLYARVDVARDERGRALVMELELIEPSLFLIQHRPALERLANACVEAARS